MTDSMQDLIQCLTPAHFDTASFVPNIYLYRLKLPCFDSASARVHGIHTLSHLLKYDYLKTNAKFLDELELTALVQLRRVCRPSCPCSIEHHNLARDFLDLRRIHYVTELLMYSPAELWRGQSGVLDDIIVEYCKRMRTDLAKVCLAEGATFPGVSMRCSTSFWYKFLGGSYEPGDYNRLVTELHPYGKSNFSMHSVDWEAFWPIASTMIIHGAPMNVEVRYKGREACSYPRATLCEHSIAELLENLAPDDRRQEVRRLYSQWSSTQKPAELDERLHTLRLYSLERAEALWLSQSSCPPDEITRIEQGPSSEIERDVMVFASLRASQRPNPRRKPNFLWKNGRLINSVWVKQS